MEGKVVFHVFPEPLDRIQFRAVGRQKDQSNVLRNRQGFGFVEPPVV